MDLINNNDGVVKGVLFTAGDFLELIGRDTIVIDEPDETIARLLGIGVIDKNCADLFSDFCLLLRSQAFVIWLFL